MQFLAIVRYSHGGRMIHEFRCPLERKAFLERLSKQDPKARVRLKQRREAEDYPPDDEAKWYQQEERRTQ